MVKNAQVDDSKRDVALERSLAESSVKLEELLQAGSPSPSSHDSDDATQGFDREDQLDQVIAAYLKAAESAQAPDEEDLLARYPLFADDLKHFFAHRRRDSALWCYRNVDVSPRWAKIRAKGRTGAPNRLEP